MRLAAIDIGSNAARLLIVEVKLKRAKPEFIKLNLVRVPLRLGLDVFTIGRISPEKCTMMAHMMRAFKALIDVYEVDAVRAYATSAMRNAANSGEVLTGLEKDSGIKVEIITGLKEADLLYQSHAAEKIDKSKSYLYVNVGGGSTELTLFAKGKPQQEISIEIGTLRLLKNLVKQSQWDILRDEIKTLIKIKAPDAIIGTGGNINKVFSLTKLKDGKPLTYHLLNSYYQKLSGLTMEERIKQFKLSNDRAEVVVPALAIYLAIMQWSKVGMMYVPKVGLVDGIIHSLYSDIKSELIL